jgi:hypothetical protein
MIFAARSQRLAKALPKGGKLTDVSGGIALYDVGSTVRVLRLSDGRDRKLVTVRGLVGSQITPAGVFYAVGRSVTFVPTAAVLRTLR